MKPEEVEKLLGGYSTGTLSESEREALLTTALRNQALFDALADEEALRSLLSDPAARRRLLQALEEKEAGFVRRIGAWLWRPAPIAAACSLAAAVVIAVVVILPERRAAPVGEMEPLHRLAPYIALKEPLRLPRALEKAKPPARPRKPPARAPAPQAPAAPPAPQEQLEIAGVRAKSAEPTLVSERDIAAAPQEAEKKLAAAPAVAFQKADYRPATGHWLEKRQPDGTFGLVTGEPEFEANEVVRLVYRARQDGQLSVMLRDRQGAAETLFSGPVERGKLYTVPPTDGLPSSPGERTLLLTFSTQPQAASSALRQAEGRREAESPRFRLGKDSSAAAEAAQAPGPYTVDEIRLRYR